MTAPYKDITRDPDAKPTSNERSPAAAPITPGVRRPIGPSPKGFTDREISPGLAARIMRYFGFTQYRAEVAERIVGVYIVADLSRPRQDPGTDQTGSDYRIVQVDLSVAHSRAPIDGTRDLVMSVVTVVGLTGGASFSLHIGDRDPIPFGGIGMGVPTAFELDPPETVALLVTNAAQAAGTIAQLMISAGVRVVQ